MSMWIRGSVELGIVTDWSFDARHALGGDELAFRQVELRDRDDIASFSISLENADSLGRALQSYGADPAQLVQGRLRADGTLANDAA